ncbi:MAG: hypothetical protein ACRCZB_09855 [Bacteroidales bacterium]
MENVVIKKTDAQKRLEIKRFQLKKLSIKARAYRDEMAQKALSSGEIAKAQDWAMKRVNDIIAEWYKDSSGASEFKSFMGWAKEGYTVKKGSRAFILWAKKRKAKNETEAPQDEPQKEEYDFFPIAHVFSDLQVAPIKVEKEPKKEPKKEEINEFEEAFL